MAADLIQQMSRFQRSVSVMRILDLGTRPEEGIGLIKEQDRTRGLRTGELATQVLFCFPDVVAR